MTGTDYRLVPMMKEMRNLLQNFGYVSPAQKWVIEDVVCAYDNAPADPREVIAKALYPITWDDLAPLDLGEVDRILRALVYPEEETT